MRPYFLRIGLGGTPVYPGSEKPRFQDSIASSFPCYEFFFFAKILRKAVFRSFYDPYFNQTECAFVGVNVFGCIRKFGINRIHKGKIVHRKNITNLTSGSDERRTLETKAS